jgi:hypothetical protein
LAPSAPALEYSLPRLPRIVKITASCQYHLGSGSQFDFKKQLKAHA